MAAPTVLLAALLCAAEARGQASPPPSTGGFFPLNQVHAGMKATAWTVFTGTEPEPMDVEILGVLRDARGPGHDMILARLGGAHAEYTGVVEGMSGSPVYIGSKLLGAVAYRLGQFSKDPIAGITPIEQMLEVRDSAAPNTESANTPATTPQLGDAPDATFQRIETPLAMSGFSPEAVRLWKQKMAGTGLDQVSAGGMGASAQAADNVPSPKAEATIVPGSAVSALLVSGDVEVSATCTVTYVDAKQLLACGHPIEQAGAVSLPMTAAEVVTTLASPMNSFKIVNTGATIGAFTQDRDAGIYGLLGARARMIPMHISVDDPGGSRTVNVEILDMPTLTAQAMAVVLYQSLLEANDSTDSTTYHVTGAIDLEGHDPSAFDIWSAPGESNPPATAAALAAGEQFQQIFINSTRHEAIRGLNIHVTAIPHRMSVELEGARLVSADTAHAGDRIVVEATLRPGQQAARNVRIPITLPARLTAGNLRLLVSDGATLDRALNPPHLPGRQPDLDAVLAQYRNQHAGDRIYVSLLTPESQAELGGETLTSLPLSMANALEPMRSNQDAGLNGESAQILVDAPANGVLSGFQIINLHIEAGGGLN